MSKIVIYDSSREDNLNNFLSLSEDLLQLSDYYKDYEKEVYYENMRKEYEMDEMRLSYFNNLESEFLQLLE